MWFLALLSTLLSLVCFLLVLFFPCLIPCLSTAPVYFFPACSLLYLFVLSSSACPISRVMQALLLGVFAAQYSGMTSSLESVIGWFHHVGWHILLSLWLSAFIVWDGIISWASNWLVWELGCHCIIISVVQDGLITITVSVSLNQLVIGAMFQYTILLGGAWYGQLPSFTCSLNMPSNHPIPIKTSLNTL